MASIDSLRPPAALGPERATPAGSEDVQAHLASPPDTQATEAAYDEAHPEIGKVTDQKVDEAPAASDQADTTKTKADDQAADQPPAPSPTDRHASVEPDALQFDRDDLNGRATDDAALRRETNRRLDSGPQDHTPVAERTHASSDASAAPTREPVSRSSDARNRSTDAGRQTGAAADTSISLRQSSDRPRMHGLDSRFGADDHTSQRLRESRRTDRTSSGGDSNNTGVFDQYGLNAQVRDGRIEPARTETVTLSRTDDDAKEPEQVSADVAQDGDGENTVHAASSEESLAPEPGDDGSGIKPPDKPPTDGSNGADADPDPHGEDGRNDKVPDQNHAPEYQANLDSAETATTEQLESHIQQVDRMVQKHPNGFAPEFNPETPDSTVPESYRLDFDTDSLAQTQFFSFWDRGSVQYGSDTLTLPSGEETTSSLLLYEFTADVFPDNPDLKQSKIIMIQEDTGVPASVYVENISISNREIQAWLDKMGELSEEERAQHLREYAKQSRERLEADEERWRDAGLKKDDDPRSSESITYAELLELQQLMEGVLGRENDGSATTDDASQDRDTETEAGDPTPVWLRRAIADNTNGDGVGAVIAGHTVKDLFLPGDGPDEERDDSEGVSEDDKVTDQVSKIFGEPELVDGLREPGEEATESTDEEQDEKAQQRREWIARIRSVFVRPARNENEGFAMIPLEESDFIQAPISPALANRLDRQDRRLLYSPQVARMILAREGMPEEKLGDVALRYDARARGNMIAGATDYEIRDRDQVLYRMRVGVSPRSISTGDLRRTQQFQIHESEHVARMSQLDPDELAEVWDRLKKQKTDGLIEGSAAGAIAAATYAVSNYDRPSELAYLVAKALGQPSLLYDVHEVFTGAESGGIFIASAITGLWVAYRFSEFERSGFRAARLHKRAYPQVLRLEDM